MVFAQTHGVPASVTSPSPVPGTVRGPLVIRGVPSSVTSLGPEGFTPTPRVFSAPLGHGFGHGHNGRFGRGGFNGGGVVGVPVYVYGGYPYYYDPSMDSDYQQQLQQAQQAQDQQQTQPQQPQQLQIVVRDKRDQEKEAADNDKAVEEAAKPKNSNLSDPPRDPAIFVFKDGSRKELGNFAIMAGMLYDLSDNKVHKYPLNAIDRDATLTANEQAGREINLP
jgi:hypothetical protein